MVGEYIPHIEDWPHQTYAVSESVRMINEGATRFCVTSPTGGGKSRIVQRLCEHYVENGKSVVVMSNRRLLTDQLLKGLHKSGIQVGCRAADFESWTDDYAPVQVISAQTEASRVLEARRKRGDDIQLHPAELVLVDESHLQKGDQAIAILNEYHQKYGAVIVGITATPLGIGHIYKDGLIVAGNNSQLRECGALVWANRFEPCVMDLHKIRKSRTGIVSQAAAENEAKSIWSQHIVANVLTSWKQMNPHVRPSIGMAPGVKESLGLAMEYWRHGINAAHIDAEGIFVNGAYKRTNDQRDRDELFAMLKDGTVPQIWNRYVLREGIDFPWLYMLQLATPIADIKGYLQTCGRVLRAFPGKKIAKIVDHAGCIRMHGSPNDDRDADWKQYFFENDEQKLTKDRHERLTNPASDEPQPITCPNCSQIRDGGAVCPACKFEHPKSVRKIIQEDGTLKPATGDVYKKRRVTMKPNTEQIWISVYHRMKNAKNPKSFRQALALFKRENGYWPPSDLGFMPKDPSNLSRKIKAVPPDELHSRKQ
jgi:superfamily II DNA or RNA helicase